MTAAGQPLPNADDRVRVGIFFALFPPAPVAARMAELARQLQSAHRLKGAMTAPERLHCTLRPIDLRKTDIAAAVTRARAAASRIKAEPFDVAFDRSMGFRGRDKHHFVLCGGHGLVHLTAFRQSLGTAMFHAELKEGAARAYTPHVTLLYGTDRLVEEHPIPPIRWRVDAFKLVVSAHGHGHRLADCWRLGG